MISSTQLETMVSNLIINNNLSTWMPHYRKYEQVPFEEIDGGIIFRNLFLDYNLSFIYETYYERSTGLVNQSISSRLPQFKARICNVTLWNQQYFIEFICAVHKLKERYFIPYNGFNTLLNSMAIINHNIDSDEMTILQMVS